ncbi:MAG TPA: tyrosine-type recombinase/integrase [Melioribacteraceae bacterium]|nr:tyrosine-type recombinase/integrase [Melioribacteraceae bacterium]
MIKKSFSLDEVIRQTLQELSGVSRAAENTIEAYKTDLKDFEEFCNANNLNEIDQITEKQIRRFVILLNEKKLSKSSVSRKLSSLRRLFNYALRNEFIEKSPLRKIPNPKVKRKLPGIINLDSFLEIYRLIDEDNSNVDKTRDKAIFELLYGSALRVSELCSLNTGDVDFKRMNIRISGKGSKVRIVPLGAKSSEILKQYYDSISAQPSQMPLFRKPDSKRIDRFIVYRIVNKYMSKVTDMKKTSPHVLRHTAATHMLDREADIMAVKEILGHENLSTTQIYTHVSIERLKKSYKKAHPKS